MFYFSPSYNFTLSTSCPALCPDQDVTPATISAPVSEHDLQLAIHQTLINGNNAVSHALQSAPPTVTIGDITDEEEEKYHHHQARGA